MNNKAFARSDNPIADLKAHKDAIREVHMLPDEVMAYWLCVCFHLGRQGTDLFDTDLNAAVFMANAEWREWMDSAELIMLQDMLEGFGHRIIEYDMEESA